MNRSLVALALYLAAAMAFTGCGKRAPLEAPYMARGMRVAPIEIGPGMAQYWTKAAAEGAARQELSRQLLLADESLAKDVRNDSFMRVAFDDAVSDAQVVEMTYDGQLRRADVAVELSPDVLNERMETARAHRAANGSHVSSR